MSWLVKQVQLVSPLLYQQAAFSWLKLLKLVWLAQWDETYRRVERSLEGLPSLLAERSEQVPQMSSVGSESVLNLFEDNTSHLCLLSPWLTKVTVPPRWQMRLLNSTASSLLQNRLRYEGILQLARAFHGQGIPYVLMKGAAELVRYGSASEPGQDANVLTHFQQARTMADTDILCQPDDLVAIDTLLSTMGYTLSKSNPNLTHRDDICYRWLCATGHVVYQHPRFGPLEVHYLISGAGLKKGYPDQFEEGIWSRRQTVERQFQNEGVPVTITSLEDTVVHLVCNLANPYLECETTNQWLEQYLSGQLAAAQLLRQSSVLLTRVTLVFLLRMALLLKHARLGQDAVEWSLVNQLLDTVDDHHTVDRLRQLANHYLGIPLVAGFKLSQAGRTCPALWSAFYGPWLLRAGLANGLLLFRLNQKAVIWSQQQSQRAIAQTPWVLPARIELQSHPRPHANNQETRVNYGLAR